MALINYSLFLPLLSIIFSFFIATQATIGTKDPKQLLNIVNAAEKIFLEIGRNNKCGQDKGFLICYPSMLLNHRGTGKVSRRFQLLDQGAEQFGQCRNLPDGPHNGVLISLHGQELLSIETSFGTKFSCSMEGNQIFGIQLRDGPSMLTSMRGCAEKSPCEEVDQRGVWFSNDTMRDNMVSPYVDDYGPLWYLSLDMLSANKSEESQIVYFPPQCGGNSKWTLNSGNVTTSLACGQKISTITNGITATTPAATSGIPNRNSTTITKKVSTTTNGIPTTNGISTMNFTTIVTKKPLGIKELKKLDNTKPGHKFEFGIGMVWLACNWTQVEEEKAKLLQDGSAKNRTTSRNPSRLIENQGCFGYFDPQQAKSDGVCQHWNSAIMTLCYDGLLDPSQGVEERFELSNSPENNVAAFCQKHKPKDNANVTRHGIKIGACSKRIQYKKEENGTRFGIQYHVIFNVSLSYTTQIYSYTMEKWIYGAIESDGFHKTDKGTVRTQTLTIHIANGTSLFASLEDPNGNSHKFADRIQAMLDNTHDQTKFNEMAKSKKLALGLLGGDLIPPADENDASWNHTLQFFSPSKHCGDMQLSIDTKSTATRLNCYKRGTNFCDQIGKKDFDELIDKNLELQRLQELCQCEDQLNETMETPPPHIPFSNKPSHRSPILNERKKRYASAERSAANEEQLVPGCEDANERMAQFGISIVFPPALDKDIEDLKKCCLKNETNNNSTNTNQQQRPKRQLRAHGDGDDQFLWKTPIAYRFAPNEILKQFGTY